jgi:hypothetical protein
VRAVEPVDYRERYARLFGHSLDICPAFPLCTVRASTVRRRYSVVGFDSQCRDRRSSRTRRDLSPRLHGSCARQIVLYTGCPDHPAPPPSPLLGSPLSSTPIGRTGQRGFVQSGFNDVPHCAAPADCPRDLVEPSYILCGGDADSRNPRRFRCGRQCSVAGRERPVWRRSRSHTGAWTRSAAQTVPDRRARCRARACRNARRCRGCREQVARLQLRRCARVSTLIMPRSATMQMRSIAKRFWSRSTTGSNGDIGGIAGPHLRTDRTAVAVAPSTTIMWRRLGRWSFE